MNTSPETRSILSVFVFGPAANGQSVNKFLVILRASRGSVPTWSSTICFQTQLFWR